MSAAARCVVLGVVVGLCWGAPVYGAPPAPSAAAPAAPRPPLSPLPKVPRIALEAPKPNELRTLDEVLENLTSTDSALRAAGLKAAGDARPEPLAAIHRRLTTIAEGSDRAAMKKKLKKIRKAARTELKKRRRAEGKKGKIETPDYLDMLMGHAEPDDSAWRATVSVVAMSRMLSHHGSVEAARELVYVYQRFGEFLRVDVQLQLEALGDPSIAALIEAQRHQAAKIGRWATRQLDVRGKAIPGETVQTVDPDVLPDVLRAYGRAREVDAARLVISYANSERTQLREAARQAVAMLGEAGNWQLRDTYEQIVGKKPPREWSWERTARELFTEFDRLRLSRVYDLFQRGLEAHRKGDAAQAVSAFDQVLTRTPTFESGHEMVPAYIAHAEKIGESDRASALVALRRAERLTASDDERKRIDSMMMTLEAEGLLERGLADQILLRRALDLDPSNDRAQKLLDAIQRGDVERETRFNRHAAAAAIALVALLAIGLIVARRPRERTPPPPPAEA